MLVHQMLAFLYFREYNDAAHYPTQHPHEFNARMYALADKYGIEDLKDFAKYSLSRMIPSPPCWLAPFEAPIFVKALGVIYTTTLPSDRGLRDLVIPVIKKHRIDLRNDSDFVELLTSGVGDGELATDVFDALLELVQPKSCLCIHCDIATFSARLHDGVEECW